MSSPDGPKQEQFSGQVPRRLSYDEIEEFFDVQQGLLLDGDNKLLLDQRRRLVELFSGNVGLVRFAAKFPIDEANPQIKGGMLDPEGSLPLISPIAEDPENLGRIFELRQPGITSLVTSLFKEGHPISQTMTVEEIDGYRDFFVGVDGRILTWSHLEEDHLLLTSLAKATELSEEEMRTLYSDILSLRQGSISDEVSPETDVESVTPEEIEEAVGAREEQFAREVEHPTFTPYDIQDLRERLDEIIAEPHPLPLREDQVEVLSDFVDWYNEGRRVMGFFSATGTGKTRLQVEIARMTRMPTLIVVSKQYPLTQTVKELREAGLRVGSYYQFIKNTFENGEYDVIVTTYDSFSSDNFPIQPSQIGAIMYDEAHKLIEPTRFGQMQKFAGGGRLELAFSGSPEPLPGISIEPLFPAVVKRSTSEYSRAGILAPYRVWAVRTTMDLSSVHVSSVTGDFDEKQVAEQADKAGLGQAAAELYDTKFRGEVALIFCSGVTHARNVAETLRKYGEQVGRPIRAVHVSYETPPDEYDEIIEQARNGEIDVICNAKLLEESVDIPPVKVVMSLAPTASIRVSLQRGGRGTRLFEGKQFTMVEFMPMRVGRRAPVSYAITSGAAEASPSTAEFQVSERQPRRGKGRTRPTPPNFTLEHSGISVITAVEEVLAIAHAFAHPEEQPKEAKTRTDIAQKYNISFTTVFKEIAKYQAAHPGEAIFVPSTKIYNRELTPEVIAYLEGVYSRIVVLEEEDESRLSMTEAVKKTGLAHSTLQNYLTQEDRKAALYARRGSSKPADYYLRETIERIQKTAPRKFAEDDKTHLSVAEIAVQLGRDKKVIRNYLRKLFGDGIEGTRGSKGGISLFWPASVVEELRNNLPPERPKRSR